MSEVSVVIVMSHPIQHFCPQFESWSAQAGIKLFVVFGSDAGVKGYIDRGFGRKVNWETIRLNFPHEFLSDADAEGEKQLAQAKRLTARLAQINPDVVLVYGYAQRLQRAARRWARRARKRVWMVCDSENRQRRSWPKRVLKQAILRPVFSGVDLFLTVGDANEEYLRAHGVPDTKLVRTGFPIDVAGFEALDATRMEVRRQVREKFGVPADATVFLMVGKLVTWKRQIDLLQSLKECNRITDSIHVVLVGSGPCAEELNRYVREKELRHAHLIGFVSPRELPNIYCAADVYVHCAEREPHSLAVSEAIYAGLPVIISDRCGSYGPTDEVQPGVNSVVYTCGNVRSLIRTMVGLTRDSVRRRRMEEESLRIGNARQTLAHGDGLKTAVEISHWNGVTHGGC